MGTAGKGGRSCFLLEYQFSNAFGAFMKPKGLAVEAILRTGFVKECMGKLEAANKDATIQNGNLSVPFETFTEFSDPSFTIFCSQIFLLRFRLMFPCFSQQNLGPRRVWCLSYKAHGAPWRQWVHVCAGLVLHNVVLD